MKRRLFRDPLFRFFLGGFIVFIIYVSFSEADGGPSRSIHINSGQINRLNSAWVKEKGRPPSEKELEKLVQSEIKEEVLYREAVQLGLGDNDRIIKRRLVQKYQFMLDDAIIVPQPSEKILRQYYQGYHGK